jgi:hypothetical protein
VEHARQQGASERHACQLVNQPRGTQRYQPTQRNDEDALTRAIIALASQYASTAGTDIDASRSSCARPAGAWARIEWSGSGDAKG